ncbi:MAG: hypothetical protein Q9217_001190 [Psora testacea]
MSTSTLSPDVSPPPLKRCRCTPPAISSTQAAVTSTAVLTAPIKPASRALRIFTWNINGIAPFLPTSTAKITSFLKAPPKHNPPSQPSLRACLRRWSWPDLVGLQEIKIAPTDVKRQASVRRIVNSPLDPDNPDNGNKYLYDTYFCLPRDKYNATGFGGKVYGVCTLVRRDVENVEIKTVDWDLEGRVLLCEMPEQNLVVFNVYAVNGTTYDYRDPDTGKVVGNRHDRKRAFHSLLSNEVKQYETRGWNAVIVGDINISRTKVDSFPKLRMGDDHVKNRADFEKKFMQELGMIDTFRHLKADERKYTYRPTGRPWGSGGDRVDLCLASKDLAPRLSDADILDSEAERGPSDHVPLYLTLSGVVPQTKMSGDRESAP